jgi:cysteine desulfurase
VGEGVPLEPLVHGGGQERVHRAGTENVPYAVGLGAACEIAQRSLPQSTHRLASVSERLWLGLQTALGEGFVLNGHPRQRLPNTLSVSFVGRIGAEPTTEAEVERAAASWQAARRGRLLRALGSVARSSIESPMTRQATKGERVPGVGCW